MLNRNNRAPGFRWALAAAAAAAVACTPVVGGGMVTHFGSMERKAEIVGKTGYARLIVHVFREGDAQDNRKVLKLPAFTQADLVLSNSGGLMTSTVPKTVLSSGFTSNKATSAFTALRPGNNYKLACTLLNSGTQTGSGYADSITLAAGTNTVTIIISQDDQIKVTTSSNNTKNAFDDGSSGWTIVKGDTYTISTGFDANEATKGNFANNGAAIKMQVILDNKNYDTDGSLTNTNRLVREVAAPADFSTWTFDTASDFNAGSTAPEYTASELAITNGYESSITFRMLNGTAVVGESKLSKLRVIQGSSIDLQLQ